MTKKYVQFHVTDDCNLRCVDCHWFSRTVIPSKSLPVAEDYINFLRENVNNLSGVRFTGGEPTLFPKIVSIVNEAVNLGIEKIDLFSNGINKDVIASLPKEVRLFISLNRPITDEFLSLYKATISNVKFLTYLGARQNLLNQLSYEKSANALIGRDCICTGKNIRFASDGFAYHCEVGMRTKNEALRTGISLWTHDISKNCDTTHSCVVKDECVSCIKTEQDFLAK